MQSRIKRNDQRWPYSILLADDHRVVAEGLQGLLNPDFNVIEIVEDGQSLLAANLRLKPDVIITDISMPKMNGIEAIRELRKTFSGVRVIILTMHSDLVHVNAAFEAGANGYVLKSSASTELTNAIQTVMNGQRYLTPMLKERVTAALPQFGDKPSKNLTARERQVLQLLAEGKIAKEIGAILVLSQKTAEFHKYRLMEKLGLHTVAELTRYAVEHGIVNSEA